MIFNSWHCAEGMRRGRSRLKMQRAVYLTLFVLLCAGFARAVNVDDLLVIGVDLDPTDPRAYPLEILNYHEIVNDVIAGRHVAITWSPLSYSNVMIDTSAFLKYVAVLPSFSFLEALYLCNGW